MADDGYAPIFLDHGEFKPCDYTFGDDITKEDIDNIILSTPFAIFSADDNSLIFYSAATVPSEGEIYNSRTVSKVYTGFDTTEYTYSSDIPWYYEKDSIVHISFDESFKNVRLKSIKYFFSFMFYVTDINLANFNTSRVTNMNGVFSGLTSITSINLDEFNTSSATNMKEMFYNCVLLTELDLSNFDTSKVTDMSWMFYGDENLLSLDISGFNTAKVENMSWMFVGCKNLTTIYSNDTNFVTTNVTESSYMFSMCDSLIGENGTKYDSSKQDASMAHIDTPNNPGYFTEATHKAFSVYSSADNSLTFYYGIVPSVGDTYRDKVVTAVYTGVDTDRYTARDDVPWYDYRDDITNVTIHSSFKNVKPSSLAYWFIELANAEFNGLENVDTSSATTLYATFYNCKKLEDTSSIADWDTSNVTTVAYIFYGCEGLYNVDGLRNWNTSKVTTLYQAFIYCYNLLNVDGLADWNTSKVTTMYALFGYCYQLENIDGLLDWDTSNVTTMYRIFRDCYKLSSLAGLRNWNTSKVTNLDAAFIYDYDLTDLDGLANWDVSKVTTFYRMFRSCSSLTNADGVANWDASSVTTIEGMFYDCSSLPSADVSKWDTAKVETMANMFRNCSSLTAIYSNDKNFVTTAVTSGGTMFTGCTNLVGGNGTEYSSSKVTYTMAHVDTSDNPGYFTERD